MTTNEPARLSSDSEERRDMHVVGVGASAGGLEALEALFKALPCDTGLAFVVIQHLSPDFKSHMEELLGKHTKMSIHRVINGMPVEPDSIYLIPAKMEMVISQGRLLLTAKSKERVLSHPIDQFFRSLASDYGRKSIGIILSGTGSDGSRGIRDISEAGGLVITQDERSAKFDGMPMNAQSTGVVNLVLPPAGIARALMKYVEQGLSPEAMTEQDLQSQNFDGMEKIFYLLHQQHGLDFSQYKTSTVGRRVQRRVDLLLLDSLESYLNYIQSNPEEVNLLYKDLLIGVTRFFRDSDAFSVLECEVVPKLFDRLDEFPSIRVWVAGCASGEEAYSIAMLIDEELRRRQSAAAVKIFATDAHHVSLQAAARGIFSSDALTELSKERREMYFRKRRDGYHVTRELRRYIVFAPHNLIRDAPFTQMDLVTCRNLLIYLQPQAQKKALAMFHFALKSSGTLFLGPSESPGDLADEFQVVNKRWRIYSKRRDVRVPLESTSSFGPTVERVTGSRPLTTVVSKPRIDSKLLALYDRLLDRRMPPSFLVSENFDIVHIFGGAEKFLQSRGGRPTNNLLDAIVDSLKTPLMGALHHAARKQDAVNYSGIRISTSRGFEDIRLIVEPIFEPKSKSNSMLVEIASTVAEHGPGQEVVSVDMAQLSRDRVLTLESELRYSQENLQATVEEMESANEELQASNEELVASNEELQSTNEELHSVNEELYTVNAEHQRRVEELAQANADMDNLLATTRVGVIFLDDELYIRRFTPEISRLFHLVPQDIGRSIEGFSHNLRHDTLIDDLKRVIEMQKEFEVPVEDQRGIPFLLRILPYQANGRADGVVLTLIDISSLKAAQANLERFKFMTESAHDAIALVDRDGKFSYVNPAFCQMLGFDYDELTSASITQIEQASGLVHFQEVFDGVHAAKLTPYRTEWSRKDNSVVKVEVSVSDFIFEGLQFLCINARDITARIEAEDAVRNNAEKTQTILDTTAEGIYGVDQHGNCTFCNESALRLLGFSLEEILGRNMHDLIHHTTVGGKAHSENDCKITKAIRDRHEIHVNDECFWRKDGSGFPVEYWSRPLVRDGYVQGAVVSFQDISIERELQMRQEQILLELEEANRAAQKASETKSEFLANMSHEIRTPMSAIMGYAEILARHVDDADNLNCVQIIRDNGKYLLDIISDILDISKIEAGKVDLVREPFDLSGLISEVLALMRIRAREKSLDFQIAFAGKIPRTVISDAKRLKQILLNLIGNAIKFTDEGSVKVVVRYVTSNNKNSCKLKFEVVDTGIGISREQSKRLFHPFTQADASVVRRYGGTGLGLAISQRLAGMLNGKITVQSALECGSTFTLSLNTTIPAKVEWVEDFEQIVAKDLQHPDVVELPQVDGCILVVDDRRDVRFIAQHFIEEAGGNTITAENGQNAFDLVMEDKRNGDNIDLVIMDMQMPVLDGYAATRMLRKHGFKKPVIALTAHAMDGDRDKCLAAGCNEYLSKPLERSSFLGKVTELLAKRTSNKLNKTIQATPIDGPQHCQNVESILIIADGNDATQAVAALLELDGHHVSVAYNGITGISKAAEVRPDCILLDLRLSDMSGSEVCGLLRANSSLRRTNIIALTSTTESETIIESSFDGHVTKPVDMAELDRLIRELKK